MPNRSDQRPRAFTTVAIIGAGFSGSMVAAQLARLCAGRHDTLRVVLVEKRSTLAAGVAYSAPDPEHVLNVPASGMSAWPDRPGDFLEWVRRTQPELPPYSFQPRRDYGTYLAHTLVEAVASARGGIALESMAREAVACSREPAGHWIVTMDDGTALHADAVVVATGHRPPDDPLATSFTGSPERYIRDPWNSDFAAAIGRGHSVGLLGSGLTAIDQLMTLSLGRQGTAITAISRHGLLPSAHATAPLQALDGATWLEPLFAGGGCTVRRLAAAIRLRIATARSAGHDWRQVIDGMRPHIARLWQAWPVAERVRFLRHARPYWEVARHRMAPPVAERVGKLREAGLFTCIAGRVLSAAGTPTGVTLHLARRGQGSTGQLRFDWLVNCTGPAAVLASRAPPFLRDLAARGHVVLDELGLGVRSDADGLALARDGTTPAPLFVVGTLRKSDLWESTAVPELRQQAALVAGRVLRAVASSR